MYVPDVFECMDPESSLGGRINKELIALSLKDDILFFNAQEWMSSHENTRELYLDFVHLSPKGHALLSEGLITYLQELGLN